MAIADDIKMIRERTGAGVMDIKSALDEAAGDVDKALEVLKKKGLKIAAKKSDRSTSEGLVETYCHKGRIAAMVEVNCETDFVALNPEFKDLAHEIALQVASLDSNKMEDLLAMPLIKEPGKTVQDLLTEKIAMIGENIKIARFIRYELGE